MSFKFSEMSIFIIPKWKTVERLEDDIGKFRSEFTKFLYSLEDLLRKRSWWNKDILFKGHKEEQAYIFHKTWLFKKGEYPAIWVGVENFKPESLLGFGKSANCYLWVDRSALGERTDKVAKDLVTIVQKKEELRDHVQNARSGTGYVLKKDLRKYIEENILTLLTEPP